MIPSLLSSNLGVFFMQCFQAIVSILENSAKNKQINALNLCNFCMNVRLSLIASVCGLVNTAILMQFTMTIHKIRRIWNNRNYSDKCHRKCHQTMSIDGHLCGIDDWIYVKLRLVTDHLKKHLLSIFLRCICCFFSCHLFTIHSLRK